MNGSGSMCVCIHTSVCDYLTNVVVVMVKIEVANLGSKPSSHRAIQRTLLALLPQARATVPFSSKGIYNYVAY